MRGIGILLICLFSTPSWAAEVRLFAGGQQVADYDRALSRVQPGDTVDLETAKFKIISRLGHGNTTQVFDIGNGQALRVPIASGLFNDIYDYRQYIVAYLKGFRNLHQLGVKTVDVDEKASHAPNYLVVAKTETLFNLREYLEKRRQMSAEESQKIDDALLKFAGSTAQLSSIGDFHAGQLRWTGADWILMDFTASSTPAVTVLAQTVFDRFSLPTDLKNRTLEAIREQRRKLGFEEGRANRPVPLQCQRMMR